MVGRIPLENVILVRVQVRQQTRGSPRCLVYIDILAIKKFDLLWTRNKPVYILAYMSFEVPQIENSKEQEPPYKLETVFFETSFKTTGDLLDGLAKLEKAVGDNPAIVLDEYQLKTDDVIINANHISVAVIEKGYDLVMAPDSRNNTGEDTERVTWEKRIEQLQQHNIQFEQGSEPREQFETIGFFFGKDGLIYAFPKMWEKKISTPNSWQGHRCYHLWRNSYY